MRTSARHLTAVAAAAVLLAAVACSASATRLRVNTQNIRIRWTALEFISSATTVRCPVTMEGSFHNATFAKVVGALVGYITRGIVARPCTGGTVWAFNGTEVNEVLGGTFVNTLPWHLTYEGFTGTLPNMTTVRILLADASFNIRAAILGITILCSYVTGAANGGNGGGAFNVGVGGTVAGYTLDTSRSINSLTGGTCPSIRMGTAGAVSQLNTNTAITITLI